MIRWTQLLLLVLLVVIMMALSESESQNSSIHDHPVGAGYHLCESEATQEMFDYFAGKNADTGEPRTAVVQGTKVAAIRTLYPGSGLRGEKLEHMRFRTAVKVALRDAAVRGKRVSMMELGSFWSLNSLLFVKEALDYDMIPILTMIEPEPKKLLVGMQNFAMNGYCGREGDNTVAATTSNNRPGRNIFVDAKWSLGLICDNSSSSTLEEKRISPCRNVTSIMEERGVEHLDLLFGDIQGAEYTALEHAPLSKISNVWLGTHTHAGHLDCIEILLGAGFTIVSERVKATRSKPGLDGFIHAYSKMHGRNISHSSNMAPAAEMIKPLSTNMGIK